MRMKGPDDTFRLLVKTTTFRWLPGMLSALGHHRVLNEMQRISVDTSLDFPDVLDPATLGCLRHLVTEALGWDNVCIVKNTGTGYWDEMEEHQWYCFHHDRRGTGAFYGTTPGHALANALISACPEHGMETLTPTYISRVRETSPLRDGAWLLEIYRCYDNGRHPARVLSKRYKTERGAHKGADIYTPRFTWYYSKHGRCWNKRTRRSRR